MAERNPNITAYVPEGSIRVIPILDKQLIEREGRGFKEWG